MTRAFCVPWGCQTSTMTICRLAAWGSLRLAAGVTPFFLWQGYGYGSIWFGKATWMFLAGNHQAFWDAMCGFVLREQAKGGSYPNCVQKSELSCLMSRAISVRRPQPYREMICYLPAPKTCSPNLAGYLVPMFNFATQFGSCVTKDSV